MRCSRTLQVAVVLSILLTTAAIAASPHPKHVKHPRSRHWHGYGYLPGYPPTPNYRPYGPRFWYGGPGFYRGRWNGGGFGPCWTPTPIGPIWNCG